MNDIFKVSWIKDPSKQDRGWYYAEKQLYYNQNKDLKSINKGYRYPIKNQISLKILCLGIINGILKASGKIITNKIGTDIMLKNSCKT